MIKVYIGDVTKYLADIALSNDSSSLLLTSINVDQLTTGTYYTSIADLGSLINFSKVMKTADVIVYSPPSGKWSDDRNGKSMMQVWTEDYLRIFSFNRTPIIENFSTCTPANKKNILALTDTRKSDLPQLWNVGCSITDGVGVEHSQRYGQLISNISGIPVSFLSAPGSSIIWVADQILRSDIRNGDIVIWGLTSDERFPYFKKNVVSHITPGTLNKIEVSNRETAINYLLSDDLLYRTITAISQAINFCKLVNAKLLLVPILNEVAIEYFRDYPNFLMLGGIFGRDQCNQFLDLGSDNVHPGILTHQYYAATIFQELKRLNWVSDEADHSVYS